MSYETITVEKDAQGTTGVTLLTLNRPKALNALNSKVLEELIDAFADYQADDSQLCAVLTGSGDKAFAAGADIKEMSEKAAADFYLDDFFSPWTSEIVKKTRKPWIAAVLSTSAMRSACGTTRTIRFDRSASSALIIRPVRHISIDFDLPIARVRRCEPPMPGATPSLISGWPNLALSEAMMKSAIIASSHPPPSANPLTAAIHGLRVFLTISDVHGEKKSSR